VGTGLCDVSGIQAEAESTTTAAECTYDILIYGEDNDITAEATCSTDELGEGVEATDTAYIYLIFRNNTQQIMPGLEVGFRNEDGVRITASVPGQVTVTTERDQYWGLPDLQPGEVGRFRFALRLLDARGLDSFSIQPVVRATGQDSVLPRRIEIGVIG
jgi:hypothetical protein